MRIDFGDIQVYLRRIDASYAETRREAERACILDLVHEALGPEASLNHEETGRPTVENAFISVSHSRHWGALAVSRSREVGIDIEEPSERILRVIGRVARGEYAERYLQSAETAIKGWTLLESSFKCMTPNDGLTLVDFHLPDPTGGLTSKTITSPKIPEAALTVICCQTICDGVVWMSLVAKPRVG